MRFRPLLAILPFLLLAAFLASGRSEAQSPDPDKVQAGLRPADREQAPLGLTASDGTGLHLVELKARAVVEGPLAFTELHLSFENPQDRVLEGRFQITLPDGAAISRFAMKIDERWQEAEVVERQAARVAYEDFLHRKQDPALLESAAGNEFSARIFPIPAKGRKELILSYSQELTGPETAYRLPLQGLPRVGKLDLEARVSASGASKGLAPEIQVVRRENYLPEGDFVVSGGQQAPSLRAGEYVVARVKPQVAATASAPLLDLLVLVDTSASRALGQTEQSELVTQLLGRIPGLQKVTVAAFDQEVKTLYSGAPSGFSPQSLLHRDALGATDLNAALHWAAEQKGYSRLLLVTDGVSTAGPEELKEALRGSSLKRLDVALVGGIRDKERMTSLVSGALPQDGLVLDGGLDPASLARKLSLGVTSGLDVSVEGALWVWPSTLDNLQPGDERLVYAQLKDTRKEIKLHLGGPVIALAPTPSSVAPLLQRQAMVARIARLEANWKEAPEGDKAALAAEIVKLSTGYRVLSEKTALLVLETEEDYARFHIDRKALADILVVGPNGLEVMRRDQIVVAQVPEPAEKQKAAESDRDLKADDALADRDGGEAAPADGLPAPPREAPGSPITAQPAVESAASVSAADSPSASRPAAPRRVPTSRDRAQNVTEQPIEAEEAIGEEEPVEDEIVTGKPALEGPMAEIHDLLSAGRTDDALARARQWRKAEPGNVLALVALGMCLEARGQKAEAARAYGSIIDLFPARADLRRFAGSRLQALGEPGLALAVDSFEKAVEQRPDHVSSHRFLALALARQARYEQAFKALEKGLKQDYPSNRFVSYQRILREDLGLMAAAWAAASPRDKARIAERLTEAGAEMATQPSLRFVLTWETDANDVDFHIHDAKQGHAFYSAPDLPSGGQLYGDVTTGYGPECFAINGKPKAFPYRLQIHYYSRGPMGYGMGQLEILEHDGQGHLLFEERPYVVMQDGAYVDLGVVEEPLRGR